MSKRDDLRAAFECRQPAGAVPIWELEFHLYDRVTRRRLLLGAEFAALSPAEQERALYANAEILLAAAEQLHFSGLKTPTGYWEIAGAPAYYWLPGDARYRQVEVLHEVGAGADVLLVAPSGGVMAMPGADDYVAFAYRLFDAPEEIDAAAQQTLARGIEGAQRYRDAGAEALVTASDIADNRGPYFGPAHMQRFFLPYLRQWAAAVRAMGCYAVLHTDGDVSLYLDDLAASGIHALQAIDPVAGMDMRRTKDQVQGRLCLCGNLNIGLLVTGAPEEAYAATRALLLGCKAGGGLVLGTSNAVQPEIPLDNYRAVIEAWRRYGQY